MTPSCPAPRVARVGSVLWSLSTSAHGLCGARAAGATARATAGSAGADERVGRRADAEGLAQRRPHHGEQLRRARRRPQATPRVVDRQQSIGSGFVIDPEGYIMTNAHVVNGAQRVQIVLPADNADGTLATALSTKTTVVPARIVGITTELDLALLKVDGLKLPALPLATYSELRQGETVFAFGSPNGLRNSLTHGMVSAVARQVYPDSPQIFVQTDAPINPGNSGGPLVNIRGEVVGVSTFIMSQSGGNEGLGFAIPSATARTVFRQLKQYGHIRRQEVGMSIQTITPDLAASLGLARDYGVIVSDVWPDGPAQKAGLAVGDILVSVDGQPADNLPTVSYNFRLRDSPDNVALVVLRGQAQISVSMQAGGRAQRLRLGLVDGGCREEPGAGVRHHRPGSGREDCGVGDRAQGSVRHHRHGPRGGRGQRDSDHAERHHSQRERPADRHPAGAPGDAFDPEARRTGDAADSA